MHLWYGVTCWKGISNPWTISNFRSDSCCLETLATKHLTWGGGKLLSLASCRTQAKPTPVKPEIFQYHQICSFLPLKKFQLKNIPHCSEQANCALEVLFPWQEGTSLCAEVSWASAQSQEKRKKGREGTWWPPCSAHQNNVCKLL